MTSLVLALGPAIADSQAAAGSGRSPGAEVLGPPPVTHRRPPAHPLGYRVGGVIEEWGRVGIFGIVGMG